MVKTAAGFGAFIALSLLSCPQAAPAQELTPMVRAMIFAPTETVRLARPVVTVPLDGTDHNGYYECPYVQVYVNGRGPFTFLIDTGASYTVVSSRVVAAARPHVMVDRNPPDRDVVRLATMRIGGVTLEHVWAVQDDNFDVDGILGFRSFGLANVLFDLANRELRVSATPFDLPGSFELPYDPFRYVPVIPLGIGGRTVPILIDTGDDAYGLEIRRSELGDARVEHPPIAAGRVINGANEQPTAVTTLSDRVTLGPVHAEAAVIGVNDSLPVGDIGYDVLRQFRVAFDPRRHVVSFQPLFSGDRFDIPANRSIGFSFSFGEERVTMVRAGSAAEQAGMTAGDTLVSIGGQPVRGFNPRRWDALIRGNASIAVRWRRAGREREDMFPIREIR